jgi:flagellar motor switch protein FliM
VTARVDGIPVMECGFGVSNERYALRVQQMISHQDSDPKSDHD